MPSIEAEEAAKQQKFAEIMRREPFRNIRRAWHKFGPPLKASNTGG
jgi:hypothetical protein